MESSLPCIFYQQQAELAAMELDFELTLAAYPEQEPQADTKSDQPENSVYNFNKILDFE